MKRLYDLILSERIQNMKPPMAESEQMMLAGMSQFLKTHNVDIDSFSRMFRYVTYEEIVTKALGFKGMSRDGAFASAIADKFAELTAMAQNSNAVASN